ncbi:MAG: hypothetical protein WBIAU1_03160 [Wolbachia endosymbiont of Drosophila biauraria]|nr:MAG: hypothetical protein WBIAU1_03160 [Wolbachia endosymbiont of Drosophila biauraria]
MDNRGIWARRNPTLGKRQKKGDKKGIKFQRLRGTPASLKIALKWANIEDITIIEEPPGKHFLSCR